MIELQDIQTNGDGFARLAALNAQIRADRSAVVVVSGHRVRWFDTNMTAALSAVVTRHRLGGREVVCRWPANGQLVAALRRNGFLQDKSERASATMVPHKGFDPADKIGFAQYTQEHLRGKGIPEMSSRLRKNFLLGLDELFGNVDLHAETKGSVHAAGQAYPSKNRLQFTLADCGIGIRQSIFRRLGRKMLGGEAIEWAVTGNNTTRVLDVPGGLGLKIVREFVGLNGGSLTIVSDTGLWQQTGKDTKFTEMPLPFPGTVVSLEVRTDDRASYALATEEVPPVRF